MALNIIGFVSKMLPSFEKSDLLTDLEISLKQTDLVIEQYTRLIDVLKVSKFNSEDSKAIVDSFYKELEHSDTIRKLPMAKITNIAIDTVELFKNVKKNGEWIYDQLDEAINDVVVSKALTTFKATLLRSVGHYYFMTRCSIDTLLYIYNMEAVACGEEFSKAYSFNKIQIKQLQEKVWLYARVVSLYGLPHNAFKDNLSKIADVMINVDESGEAEGIDDGANVDIASNLPQGFIGSPIYSIRLIFAQWEADRYKEMKDKKRLLELRLIHYKMLKEQGQSDVNTEKEIEYLNKRIEELDYKTSKLEQDVEI